MASNNVFLLTGALALLPTILFLATEVLKESKSDPVLSEAGILLLQRAAECKTVSVHEETNAQHAQLLQTTLTKIVDRVKSGMYNLFCSRNILICIKKTQ